MKVTEYAGEDISRIASIILYNMFTTASDIDFVQDVHTIQKSQDLGLLPDFTIERFLDSVINFYTLKYKVGCWAKEVEESQDAFFVAANTFEQWDCYNFWEK
eukprot:12965360-Ditylum_brightwellii.AAC.1